MKQYQIYEKCSFINSYDTLEEAQEGLEEILMYAPNPEDFSIKETWIPDNPFEDY